MDAVLYKNDDDASENECDCGREVYPNCYRCHWGELDRSNRIEAIKKRRFTGSVEEARMEVDIGMYCCCGVEPVVKH